MAAYRGRHRVGNTPKIVPTVEALGDFDKWVAESIPLYTSIGWMSIVLDPMSAGVQLYHLRNATLTIEFDAHLNLTSS